MSREWKPGDMAMRIKDGRPSKVTVATIGCDNPFHGDGLHWHHVGGGWDPLQPGCPDRLRYNPLVVIDPEYREQVERLALTLRGHKGWCGGVVREATDAMQAALRSLVAPPKPEEPQGLGAVVEDSEGVRWTRVEAGDSLTHNPWYPAGDEDEQPAEYADIAAVRVLSEGIS